MRGVPRSTVVGTPTNGSDPGHLRLGGNPALRLALGHLVGASAVLVLVEIVLTVEPQADSTTLWLIAGYPLVGFADVAVGAIAWDRRPHNHTGALLCLSGYLVCAAALDNTPSDTLHTLGYLVSVTPIAALLHLMMAFPSGRLRGRLDRALVTTGYLLCVLLQVPRYLFGETTTLPGLLVADRPDLTHAARVVQAVTGSAVLLVAVTIMVARLRRTDRVSRERRALGAVYLYGYAGILFFPFSANFLRPLLHLTPIAVFLLQITMLAGVPFVFLAALLRGGYVRTGQLADLRSWLGHNLDAGVPLRDALADTLGDPSLQLLFRGPSDGRLLDPSGREVAEPVVSDGRAVVETRGRGDRGAVIVYDRSMIADAAVVEAVGDLVGLSLDRELLTAQLLASRAAVERSRARIVEVSDQERRRIARDLHDLLQSRLVLAALHAGRLAATDASSPDTRRAALQLRVELEDTAAGLRQLVHGVMPALLVERGLLAAAEELADRSPVPVRVDLDDSGLPIPTAVATTAYFILAEAVSNTVKHAHAATIAIRIARVGDALQLDVTDDGVGGAVPSGSGLRGLVDRVEALRGRLTVDSRPGCGTRVEVELPCGS